MPLIHNYVSMCVAMRFLIGTSAKNCAFQLQFQFFRLNSVTELKVHAEAAQAAIYFYRDHSETPAVIVNLLLGTWHNHITRTCISDTLSLLPPTSSIATSLCFFFYMHHPPKYLS
jgi:hypothetical protein